MVLSRTLFGKYVSHEDSEAEVGFLHVIFNDDELDGREYAFAQRTCPA